MDTTQAAYPLRQMRLAAGLTIRELETATGINRGRLSILERGVVPRQDEADRILRALAAAINSGPRTAA
jgi:transcriptional regulator with XRE-family HTH domain